MISFLTITPHEMTKHITQQMRAKRLSLNLSQKTLSEQSGVSLGTLKKFETTGQISLESLLKLSLVLDSLEEFENLFKITEPQKTISLDHLLKEKKRKRGRK